MVQADSSVVEWSDPPSSKRISSLQEDIAVLGEDLLAHPGRWAVVYEDLPYSTAYHRAGKLREADFEAKTGRRGNGYAVWAMAPRS